MAELRAVGSPPQRTHTIGEVINLLRPEFPDVSVSKVRFLESRGLIQPGRSSSGYRIFDDDDVQRIQYVLTEQRDHYLPLKVIKSKLSAWDKGNSRGLFCVLGCISFHERGTPVFRSQRRTARRIAG